MYPYQLPPAWMIIVPKNDYCTCRTYVNSRIVFVVA